MKTKQNKNARIGQKCLTQTRLSVETLNRDNGSLRARVNVRERTDVVSGRSLQGLSIKTASGRNMRFSGREARTLLRVLQSAVSS